MYWGLAGLLVLRDQKGYRAHQEELGLLGVEGHLGVSEASGGVGVSGV